MRELTLMIPDAQYARLCDPAERRALEAELRWLLMGPVRMVWDSAPDNGNGRITSLVEKVDFEPQRLTEAEVEGMTCPVSG